MRELILDDTFPRALARELRARGRPARAVAELGLEVATDAELAAAVGALDAVLVSTVTISGPTVALVHAPAGPRRREAVHRHAHAMATQRPGSHRRYP